MKKRMYVHDRGSTTLEHARKPACAQVRKLHDAGHHPNHRIIILTDATRMAAHMTITTAMAMAMAIAIVT